MECSHNRPRTEECDLLCRKGRYSMTSTRIGRGSDSNSEMCRSGGGFAARACCRSYMNLSTNPGARLTWNVAKNSDGDVYYCVIKNEQCIGFLAPNLSTLPNPTDCLFLPIITCCHSPEFAITPTVAPMGLLSQTVVRRCRRHGSGSHREPNSEIPRIPARARNEKTEKCVRVGAVPGGYATGHRAPILANRPSLPGPLLNCP
jgi:hypothetical protein